MKNSTIRFPVENTRTRILDELLDKDLSALELADILDINESAVRRHLKKLENRGLIDSYFEKAVKGRPKKYFQITEKGERLFPKKTELILDILIKNLIDLYEGDEMETISDRVAEDLKDYFPPVEDGEDFHRRVEKIVEGSKELGFYTSYIKEDDHYSIKHRNCVFGNITGEEASWLCEVHMKIMRDLLGDVSIEQKSSMLKGDKVCLQIVGE